MELDGRIYVAGHLGMVGSSLVRALCAAGFKNLILVTRAELDLKREDEVQTFFSSQKPDYVFVAAARVGGILANSRQPVEFLLDNLRIQNNVIRSSFESGVKKLLFLGSSCIYPRLAAQPIREEELLTGPLESTNEAYAIAKIAGMKLCEYHSTEYGAKFVSAMPTNLYGPNDNYDLETGHVLPALIRRFHVAKVRGAGCITLWGSGSPKREFLHADDLAEACLFLMDRFDGPGFVNVGCGEDLSVRELAELIRDIVGYQGEIEWDSSKPDGTPRKLLDVSRIRSLGWRHRIPLAEGIHKVYEAVDKSGWGQ